MHPGLAAGAAVAAVPILIHILSRRRVRVVRWAAMEFLLAALKRRRRRVRIEQLLLLALRVLVALLLALMIARPFLRPAAAAALLGSAPRTERIIVLDDSLSMSARTAPDETVFLRATRAVRQIAHWVAAEFPADGLSLIVASDATQPAIALPSLSAENLDRLDRALPALVCGQGSTRVGEAIALAEKLIGSAAAQPNAAVYVVSDFQRGDWIGEGRPSPLAPLAEPRAGQRRVRVTLVDVGSDRLDNAALTRVELLAPQVPAGVPVRVGVDVTNFGREALSSGELRPAIAEQALPAVSLPRIASGATHREIIEVAFPQEGADRLSVELAGPSQPDALARDDRRATGVDVAAAVAVLIVDGEPAPENSRDEAFLLRVALSPSGRVASGNDVRVVEDEQLDGLDLRPFHVVILANVYRISDAGRRRLEEFVADGGGLVIFLGDQVDAENYNERLFASGAGLLPVELGESLAVPAGADGLQIESWDSRHPIFRPFVGGLAELLRSPRFFNVIAVRSAASTQPATSSPTSGPTSRPAAQTLAALNDADHAALLVERPFGRGRVLLFTSSADLEWNQWARDPSFIAAMLQTVQYVARPVSRLAQTLVGSDLVLPIDPGAIQPRAALRLPSYPVDPPLALEARTGAGGVPAFVWPAARQAGVYQFDLRRAGGESAVQFAAANPDPRESDLRRATADELRRANAALAPDVVRDIGAGSAELSDARRELWWPISLLVVGLLMVEQTLARWFGARG